MKLRNWFLPIIKQWPVFIIWIMLVGWFSLKHYPFPRLFVISLHAYFVAFLACNKLLKVFVYIIAFTLFAIQAFVGWAYGLRISPTLITLIAETSSRESLEFVTQALTMSAFWKTLGFGGGMLILVAFAEKYRESGSLLLSKIRWIKPIMAVVLIVGLACNYVYIHLFRCNNLDEVEAWSTHSHYPYDNMTQMVSTLYAIYLSKQEIRDALETLSNTESVTPVFQDSVSIILVIGESYIRQHSQLYGYPLQTNPFMDQECQKGNLVAFSDAVSPYKFTTQVVRNIISCNSLSDGENWSKKPPLTAVFHNAGFYVSMFDNQRNYGQNETFCFALNTYLFHPQMLKTCYDVVGKESFDYDLQIVEDYAKQRRTKALHELSVFHLMGQHFQANCRYPAEYTYFTSDSLSWRKEEWLTENKRQLIANYDNATRYNDLVIQRITELYQDRPAILVYVSDHGEELFDYRDSQGRVGCDDIRQELLYQYAVPMFVWWNERYGLEHPDIIEALMIAKERPFMISDIYQMLFHLGGLTNSSYYRSSQDVLDDDYICPIRILDNQWNYDQIIRDSQ